MLESDSLILEACKGGAWLHICECVSGTYDLDGVTLTDRYVGGSPVDSNPGSQAGDSQAEIAALDSRITNAEASIASLQVGGTGNFMATATDYAADAADFAIKATGAVTVTLPTAVGIPGKWYVVKNAEGGSDSVNVATTGGQTIDGAASPHVLADGDVARLMSDGANWILI